MNIGYGLSIGPPDKLPEPTTQDIDFDPESAEIVQNNRNNRVSARKASINDNDSEFKSIEKFESYLVDERYKVGERMITDHSTLE